MNNPTREGDSNANYISASYKNAHEGGWAPLIASYAITASYLPTAGQQCFSASYACTSSYIKDAPEHTPLARDKGVREFFEKLGYTVECESRGYFEFWYNIINKDGKLVVQIDQGVPLADIVMDICQFHLGLHGISKSDYKVSGPKSPELDLLFKQVFDFSRLGIEADGQLTLPL